ncbi:MAG: hypothetical protein GAK43_01791 [Stenotrophomonas maltophilia]|nr:MAG: hypothetical protein GAK43_01791 [Stenotrophomonas maltophilia]
MDIRRQRGAIGVMAAITLLLALVCLALLVDTGRLYLEQRKLQRVADMAALESAAQSGLCGSQSSGDVQTYALASATRNDFPSDGTLTAMLGDVTFNAAGTTRQFSTTGTWKDAVQVSVSRTVPSSLLLNVLRFFNSGTASTATLSATAVARRGAIGAISAGSGLLSVDSSRSPLLNALLGKLLGTTLNLDALTYQGIAKANVNLLALGQQLQAAGVSVDLGSVDSLLNSKVNVGTLLNAAVNAVDASQVAGVNTALLRNALATVNVPTAQLSLGQILSVVAPDSVRNEALRASVNLADLLMATAMVANRNSAVAVPGLSVGIAGVNATVNLTVIQPPQLAIGYPGKDSSGQWRTVAKTAQVSLAVVANADLLNLHLVNATINLNVAVAQGYAALSGIACAGQGQARTVTVAAAPGIASASVSAVANLLGNGSSYLATATITSGAQSVNIAPGTEQTLTFPINTPADLPTAAQRVQSSVGGSLSSGIAALGQQLKVDIKLLPLCDLPVVGWLTCGITNLVNGVLGGLTNTLSSLISVLTSALSTVIAALGTSLIDPLLSLLGIQAGILDVRVIDVQTAGAELLL